MIFIFFLLSEANFKIFLVELMSLKNIFRLSESPTSPEPAQCITVSILAKYLCSIFFLILLFFHQITNQNLFKIKSNVVAMKNFNDDELKSYLSKISDNALYAYNVYQIEGEGRNLFSSINGDKDTIMGLPIKKIKEYLKVHGN